MINRHAECDECSQRFVVTCQDTHDGALQADALIILDGWEFIGNSDGVWMCPECISFDDNYFDYNEYVPGGLYT